MIENWDLSYPPLILFEESEQFAFDSYLLPDPITMLNQIMNDSQMQEISS